MIFTQIILCILTIVGYYFIKKEPIWAYLIFIFQNLIAFGVTGQWYMVINIIAAIYFGQSLMNKYEQSN